MPRFTREVNGEMLTVETAVPSEAAELRRDGFREEKAKTKAVREGDAAVAAAVTPANAQADAKPAAAPKK